MRAIFWLAAALGLRLVAGLAAIILIARALPPADFGVVALGLTFGATVGFFSDLGASVNLLRLVGAEPARAEHHVNTAINAKINVLGYILLPVLLLGLGAGIAKPLIATFAVSFTAACVTSISDLLAVTFRGASLNRKEFTCTALSSLLGMSVLILGTLNALTALETATLLLASRIVSLCVIVIYLKNSCSIHIKPNLLPLGELLKHAYESRAWALSTSLAYVNGQIDSFLVGPILGPAANGLYQSVARFLTVASQVPAIATNYWAPRAAGAETGLRARLLSQGAFAILASGALVAAGFAILGPMVTHYALPHEYAAAKMLWGPLAILTMCRNCAAAVNLWLVTKNQPRGRLWGEAVALAVNLLGILVFGRSCGLVFIPYVLAAGTLVTAIIGAYYIRADRASYAPGGST